MNEQMEGGMNRRRHEWKEGWVEGGRDMWVVEGGRDQEGWLITLSIYKTMFLPPAISHSVQLLFLPVLR